MEHTNKKKPSKFLKTMKKLDLSTNKNKYMVQNFERFRIRHPTTRDYQFLTGDMNSKNLLIFQYFIFSGLGISDKCQK